MAPVGPLLPEQLEITSHCLLRYCIALALEAAGRDHGFGSAVAELNTLSGRVLTAQQWLVILEPAYLQQFAPSDTNAHLS